MSTSNQGVWLPIAEADRTKKYDLIISDGQGYRWRETDCRWRRGSRNGKAGWYYIVDGAWCPVGAVDAFIATHCMETPDFPENTDIGRAW